MKLNLIVAAVSMAAVQAFAQMGPGGPGGPGPKGAGPGPMCQDKDAPSGCKLMSADEMKAHQEKMRGMTDKNSCMAYMDEHHQAMKERAAKAGQTFPDKPGYGRCERMK